ncbi:MAG: AraC family transcriptional regulator [Marinobacter sp.]
MVAGAQLTGPVRRKFRVTVTAVAALFVVLVLPPGQGAVADTLDREIDRVKADVADLSQRLYELEEDVLYPVDTRVAVFLTLRDRDGLELDTVELYLNDTPVASHLYTERERGSLKQGGVQRLYMGNLPHGSHQLKAVLTARSANERFVRREVTHDFRKRPGESRIQMTLDAKAPDYEPVVSFQEWK